METNVYRSYMLYNYKQIPHISKITDDEREAIEVVGRVLPFKTNNYVINELINWDSIPNDPIFNLNFPCREMLLRRHYNLMKKTMDKNASQEEIARVIKRIRSELNPNPSGQEYNIPAVDGIELKGVQHKYRETVLFFPSQGQTCHAYCTFCFRWPQFSDMHNFKFAMKENELLVKYLKTHPKVTDVLFTGGDPMTMTAKIMASYIEPLLAEGMEHIQTIRIGTKSLAYWPYRFLTDNDADDVIQLFEKVIKSGKNLAIMAHFNHPVELSTEAVKQAIIRIRSTGAQIRTQSPLLKNINDNPDVWAEMWRKQVNLNCIPYYMFVERDTGAKQFFEVPLERCWNIFRKAYQSVSGVCRTVRGPSMSANPGKIQILGVTEVAGEKVFVLRFLQGRDPDWAARPFFAKYDAKATWLNQLKPAFGEEKFFYEDELNHIKKK
ncbi:MAG: lysine 2,3-aminomutase [Prevotellaceae bacterium]|jgi:KamA family protein|nr:lysine 2,3-aminomutase [Prevotellaceae bacterium]